MKKSTCFKGALAALFLAAGMVSANAACVTKAARATASTEKSAKWYVMETIVQQVSWGLWPAWVSTGKIPGHTVKKEFYRCKKANGSVSCFGQATICETKK